MKKFTSFAFAALLAFGLGSCATIGTKTGAGLLFTSVMEAETATSNQLGTKVGTASASNILGLAVTGDASIEQAAKKAGIRRISHVDSRKTNILGFFSTYTVYVYGE